MTIKQFKYFLAIYQSRNMTKAADSLFVSRPVLSRSLHQLETELGMQLFVRTADGVEPTEKGESFYKTLSAVMSIFTEAIKRMREDETKDDKRSLKIGILDSSGSWFYPLMYMPFCEKFPEIDARVEGVLAGNVMESLLSCKLDCAISPLLTEATSLIGSIPLYCVEWVLCSSFKKKRDCITVNELEYLPMAILDTLPPPFYSSRDIVLSTRQQEMLRMAVSQGYAYAVLPTDLVSEWDDVARTPFEPRITATVYLLWNKAVKHNKAFESFLEYTTTYDFNPLKEAFSCP